MIGRPDEEVLAFQVEPLIDGQETELPQEANDDETSVHPYEEVSVESELPPEIIAPAVVAEEEAREADEPEFTHCAASSDVMEFRQQLIDFISGKSNSMPVFRQRPVGGFDNIRRQVMGSMAGTTDSDILKRLSAYNYSYSTQWVPATAPGVDLTVPFTDEVR